MMTRIFFILTFLLFVVMAFAQKNALPKYKLIVDVPGPNAKMGDIVIAHVKFQNERDTLDTYQRMHGGPVNIALRPSFKGCMEEGLTNASIGDSIAIEINNDSLYTRMYEGGIPEEIPAGSFTTFYFKILDVQDGDSLRREWEESKNKRNEERIAVYNEFKQQILDSSKVQLKKEDEKIIAYINKNKLKAQRTKYGVYYSITKEGNGIQAKAGDTVVVNYKGRLLNGKEFDKSNPENPFVAQICVGNVIPGFDEGIMQMKQGSKATIIIPSPFAYGDYGVKGTDSEYQIPPNSPLIFDIELIEVKKWKK